jgi:hypothetical protein
MTNHVLRRGRLTPPVKAEPLELINKEKSILSVKGEKIIIAALLLILATEIGKAVWPMAVTDSESADAIRNFIAQKSSPKNMLIDAVSLFGSFLLTMSLIVTGIRHLRSKWTSIKGIAFTIIGLAILLYHIAEIESYKSIWKTLDDIKRPNLELVKFKAEQENLPLKSKSMLSRMYAHEKYLHEGKNMEYISESGETKRFTPTSDDVKFRNVQNYARKIWNYNNKRLPKLLQWWVAVGSISLVLGVITPIRKAAPNTRLDHDRA